MSSCSAGVEKWSIWRQRGFLWVVLWLCVCAVVFSEGDHMWSKTAEAKQLIQFWRYIILKSHVWKDREGGEVGGGSFLLQLIFLKYFAWILAAVGLEKTKGNEPRLLEPKTTHSVRKSHCSYCVQGTISIKRLWDGKKKLMLVNGPLAGMVRLFF